MGLNLGSPMRVVGAVIGSALVLLLLAALAPVAFGATEDFNSYMSDETTTVGNPTADSLLSVFPIVIGITVIVGIVGFALRAFNDE